MELESKIPQPPYFTRQTRIAGPMNGAHVLFRILSIYLLRFLKEFESERSKWPGL
jgi:hypothetical protein